MSTSGSVSYTTDRDELIKDSLHLIGEIGEGVIPTTDQITRSSRVLNKMIKAWQAYGLQLWKIKQASISPIVSDYKYTIGSTGQVVMNRPLRIIDIYRRKVSTVTDVVLTKMSRQEYYNLPDKDTTGTPVNYYYDPKLDNGILHVWPAPDASFATNYTLEILYQDPIEDMISATDNFDFPSEWLEALTYNLAVRLAVGTGLGYYERKMLKEEAKEALFLALSWDNEDGSIFLSPDQKGMQNK